MANERYHRVQIHALVAMSNHFEIVATDAYDAGQQSHLPRFFNYANSLIAKAMNHRLGRGENFWAPGSYRSTEIHGEEALRDRLVYRRCALSDNNGDVEEIDRNRMRCKGLRTRLGFTPS